MPRTATPATATDDERIDLSPRDPRLAPWRAFMLAQLQVSRRLDEDLRSGHHLSLQEYGVLLLLAEAPDQRLRMSRLADDLALSRSGVTRVVDRLVRDELVERVSCTTDARGSEAQLTARGLTTLRAASVTHLRGIAEYFLAAIDRADLPAIERSFESISRRLRARDSV